MITRGIFLTGLILGVLAIPSLQAQDKKEEKKEDFVPPELQGAALSERKFFGSNNSNTAFSIESNSLWEEPAIQAKAPKQTAPV